MSHASNTIFIVFAALGDPAPRQVVLQPADAVEVRVEAPAGDGLDEVEDVLAVAEAVERGRDRADLQAHLAEEQHEGGDARQLGEDRADVLRARRRLDPHEQLGAVDERHLVREARQPVDAVDQRGDLRVGAELGELLVAAVHVADDRIGRDHPLAVEAHDETQRAVRRRVLRPEVEDHVAGVELDVHLRVGEVTPRLARHLDLRKRRGCAGLGHVSSSGGVRSSVGGSTGPPSAGVSSTAACSPSVGSRRRASARRRRDPATASPRARAAGSPCAAGGPRTPTGGRGGAGSGGRRTRCRTSPSTRARASRRRGRPTTHDSTRGSASSTSVFSVTPHLRCASTRRARTPGSGRPSRRRRRSSRWAAPAPTCRPTASSPSPRRRHASRCRRRTRGSRSSSCPLADLGGAAPGVGPHAHDERRRTRRRARRSRRRARARSRSSSSCSVSSSAAGSSSVVVGRRRGRRVRDRLDAPRAPRPRQPTTIGSPLAARRSSSLPMPSFWMRSCSMTMPWRSASGRGGQPGTYTSTGMIWSTPLVTEYESQ